MVGGNGVGGDLSKTDDIKSLMKDSLIITQYNDFGGY